MRLVLLLFASTAVATAWIQSHDILSRADKTGLRLDAEDSCSFDTGSQSETALTTKHFLEWIQERNAGVLNSTYVGTCPDTGLRGLYSKNALSVNTRIFSIPYENAMLVSERALSDETGYHSFPRSNFQEEIAQGLSFLQAIKGDSTTTLSTTVKSNSWKPYVDILPKSTEQSLVTPDFWTRHEIQQLEVPSLIQETLAKKTQLESAAATCTEYSPDEIQWATWMVQSRRFTISYQGQTRRLLVPYLDMINHSNDPNAEVRVAPNTLAFELIATRSIAAGQDITIGYGTGHETSLGQFGRYGFWTNWKRDNSANSTHFDLGHVPWSTTLEEDEQALSLTRDPVLRRILGLRIHLKLIQLVVEQERTTRQPPLPTKTWQHLI